MKSYLYTVKPTRTSDPNNEKIRIYRIKNNTPHLIAETGRGYRSEHQAVVETLVAKGELPKTAVDAGNAWMMKRDGIANINSVAY